MILIDSKWENDLLEEQNRTRPQYKCRSKQMVRPPELKNFHKLKQKVDIGGQPVKHPRIAPNHWAMAIDGEKMTMPRYIKRDPRIV